jgi:hypothetical protein
VRQSFALHDKLLAHSAPVGWELISFNGDYVWPSEPLKPYENLRSAFLECRLNYVLEQILR